MMNETMNSTMTVDLLLENVFGSFSCKAQMKIAFMLNDVQIEKLEKLIAMKWYATKVYPSGNGRQCAIVLKAPSAVGILYPNGVFHRPVGRSITLDTDLLNRSI